MNNGRKIDVQYAYIGSYWTKPIIFVRYYIKDTNMSYKIFL
jgi:hypothetical protein